MGLSERERKVLEELERGLYAEDADLAKRFKKVADQTPARKVQRSAARMVAGSMIALGGISVVLVGAITHYALIGIAGFAMMLAGLLVASSAAKPTAGSAKAGGAGSTPSKPKRPSLNDFFEERWNNRMNGR